MTSISNMFDNHLDGYQFTQQDLASDAKTEVVSTVWGLSVLTGRKTQAPASHDLGFP